MGKKKGKGKSHEGSAPPVQEQPSGSHQQVPTPQEPPQPKKQEENPQQSGGKKKNKKQEKQEQGQHPIEPPQGIPQQPTGPPRGTPQPQQGYPSQQMGPPPHQGYPPQQIVPPTQQPRGPSPQWPRGPAPQQQRGPAQQHQRGPAPQQQQGAAFQQQRGPAPQQQQWVPASQQQGGAVFQQQRGPAPQQQGGATFQQQRGPAPQQQWVPAPQQQGGATFQQQRGPAPQQQGGPAPQQQRGPAPQQQRGPAPQQQRGPAPQQQRGPAPQQQRGPAPQQQGGAAFQQQRGPAPQQQRGLARQQHFEGRGTPTPHQPGSDGDQHARRPPQQAAPTKESVPTKQLARLQVAGSYSPLKYKEKVVPGTEGRRIKIETNHLALVLGKIQTAYHYDVNLVPDRPKKYLRPVMELFRQQMFPKRYPAFDGVKNLYSASPLPIDGTMSATIKYTEPDGRDKEYKVEVKFANEVDMRGLVQGQLGETPREALQVVDIVLRSAPSLTLTAVGRSFFHKPEQIIELGEGMEMYHGFYQSAIRGWKPFLNVDVAHKAFPKSICVIDALEDLFSSGYRPVSRQDLARGLDRFQWATFEKYIKTLKVTYEIPNVGATRRSYRVNGLGDPAAVKKFRPDNGPEMTIEQYFSKKYGTRLRYPHLPTLWVGNRDRQDKMLLPLEFCTIEANQAVNRKMTENQTSNMIRHAATSTSVRKDKIMRALNQAGHNRDPTVREFGFSIANEFEKLEARVLTPPRLGYGNNSTVNVARGVWRGDKFFNPANINSWTIVCADRPPRGDELGNLARMISRHSRDCGMTFVNDADKPFENIGNRAADIKNFFNKIKGKYQIIFVVVPNSGTAYSMVKSAAEINTGCLTQCLKMNTLCRKMNPQTVINILLKVNAKLNGLNHVLMSRPPILSRPCMIMGADVTHPSPDAQNIPSVAAVTASYEPKAFKYNICWRLQPPRVEIIEDLQAIVEEQLWYFHNSNNGMKPERIVFFRDGVSEGQFEQVIHSEIRAIRAACRKIQPDGYEPKITFLVVQKRHHTRLFPLNPQDSQDKNFNVPAGTCVDTTITHPHLQDFYLVSHASIQGVAKPTKYCTLWDDNDMSNDDVEALAYHLCHMFTRCTRSVSYPAPTYYAHLAAARAKVYIENENLDMNNLNRERERFLIKDVIRKDQPMFFV